MNATLLLKPSWLLTLALLVPAAAFAEPPSGEAAPAEADAMGSQTQAWLDLQISNNAALGGVRPMPGEVADQVYSRYVKSFSHPIPENFERKKYVEGGGSQ